jgi:hypothetical protein
MEKEEPKYKPLQERRWEKEKAKDSVAPVEPVVVTPETLAAEREKVKANAGASLDVKPTAKTTSVIFKSIDGRKLQVGINKDSWEGTTITVPKIVADDVERLLADGHYLATRIN